MNVHLFGNGPSPAVATFGLRKTTADSKEEFGEDAIKFVHHNFYIDDGLASLPTAKQAIAPITATQAILRTANLRLHKIVLNSIEVMEAFPVEDRGKGVHDLDLHHDSLPAQCSLGVFWDLKDDSFTCQVTLPDKPFTRRGVLSTINSIYDPLGLAVPVSLEGRLLPRKLVIMGKSKNDDPLPDALLTQWQHWRNSLAEGKGQRPGSTEKAMHLRNLTARELQETMTVIVYTIQRDSFSPELSSTFFTGTEPAKASHKENGEKKRALKGSPLYQLDPFVDSNGIVYVRGHLRQAQLAYGEKHPALLPKSHHVANLVVHHYHYQVHHQGHQITHGAI